ncbi:MAG: hypothetical protein ACRCW0_05935 [Clostridium sp.]
MTITFQATLQDGNAVSYQRIIVTIYPRKNNGGSSSPQTIEVPVRRNELVYGLVAFALITIGVYGSC